LRGKNILALTTKEIANDNRVINYTNALANHGHQVSLICPESRKQTTMQYQFSAVYISLFVQKLPSFFVFNLIKILEFIFRSMLRAIEVKCEIIHANDLQGLVVASFIKRFVHKEATVVYDAHEYETEANGIKGFRKKVYQFLEKRLIKRVSRVITVSDTISNEYVRLYGVEQPIVLLNVPKAKVDPRKKYNLFRKKLGIRRDQRIFLYQGYLMPGRGVEIMLNTFSKLDADKNVIVFMGKGKLKELVDDYQVLGNIYFHDFVDPSEFLNYTSSADVGISFIQDISLSDRYCLPNKLFEYISCGLPVICSNLPEMKMFVETNKVGVVANDNTEEGFKNALDLINSKDLNFFKANTLATSTKYSWLLQEEKLIQLYNQM
jgi:glycosyltransferase involved in cell wall biosynthesis